MTGELLFVLTLGGLFLVAIGAIEYHDHRVKQRQETIWPGGHVVSPQKQRRGLDSNDWKWVCKYCDESHWDLPDEDGLDNDWSERCEL